MVAEELGAQSDLHILDRIASILNLDIHELLKGKRIKLWQLKIILS